MNVRVRILAALACLALAAGTVSSTGTAEAQEPTLPVFIAGQAQIVPGFNTSSQWIRQQLWVETEFDTDGDGQLDRMHVDVTRPLQTQTEGLKVPVVYETSPYYAGTASTASQYFWNVNHEVGATPPPRVSPPLINHQPNRTAVSTSHVSTWVPRGFAVVHSDSPGTGLSQGCPTVGGINESLAPKAVIDWLNGRAKGFTSVAGDTEVVADWSTGKVGMTGTSYNGTLPLAAATTGVDGLEAIIPIAPNTSYYHYYRSNGMVRNPGGWVGEDVDYLFDYINSGFPATRQYCIDTVRVGLMNANQDRTTGDYNDFWAGRDYLNVIDNVEAAVLMAHAFNDWNVIPEHSKRITDALKDVGVPLQMYYHQGGHGGAPPLGLQNRWFTRYLYGVDNGVENDPKAWVTRETATCPARTATVVGDQANTDVLTVADTAALNIGMTLTIPQTNATNTITNTTRVIVDVPDATTVLLASAVATAAGQRVVDGAVVSIVCSTANPTPYGDYPNPAADDVTFNLQAGAPTRGGFTPLALADEGTETLVDDVTCNIGNLAVAASSPNRLVYTTPSLSAPLHISGSPTVTVRMAANKPALSLSVTLVRLPWSGASACTSSTIATSTSVVTRGWADPQNHSSITNGEPLVPGQFYDVTFELQPDDQILPAGTQLGLVITSSDREFTIRPAPGTELTVDLAGTSLDLPVVGGRLALGICDAADPRSTVEIGGIATRVVNHTLAGTCSINSHIMEGEDWPTPGAFVAHVTELVAELVAAGIIDVREGNAIIGAAARSQVDHTSVAGGAVSVRFTHTGEEPVVVSSASVQQLDCDTLQPIGGSTPAGAAGPLVQDSAGVYRYPWATSAAWAGSCRQLTLTFADGGSHQVVYRFHR